MEKKETVKTIDEVLETSPNPEKKKRILENKKKKPFLQDFFQNDLHFFLHRSVRDARIVEFIGPVGDRKAAIVRRAVLAGGEQDLQA